MLYLHQALMRSHQMRSTQVDENVALPPVTAELSLSKKARAGLEAFRQLVFGIRQAAARGTPADALSYAITQVRTLHEPLRAMYSCDP